MKKNQLTPFLEIEGISAASGLVYHANSLFIISDNSTFLYQYNLYKKTFFKWQLFTNSQENIVKKDKEDFEAITLFKNKLYIYGSGSTQKRTRRVTFNLENKEIKVKNLSKIYKILTEKIPSTDDELNIEGVIITDETTYFFQRGNGANAQNGIFSYDKKSSIAVFNLITLPKINGIEATFTDAIIVENTIYFLAAAENTCSTYDDGEVMGSIIGTLDLKSLRLLNCIQISDKYKLEGITLFKKTATHVELLLCEDNDTAALTTTIYKLILE